MHLRDERQNKSIGLLFKLIEEFKKQFQIEDYSPSQYLFKNVFLGTKFGQSDSRTQSKICFQKVLYVLGQSARQR